MKRTVIFTAALLIAASSGAQLSEPYADWAEGPAKFLMTKDEVRGWRSIRSNEEAKAFIDLFWARRDPTPPTSRNEFREEFEWRVAFADHYFTTTRTRGAMSDRGRVLILLGAPFRMGGTGGGRVAEPGRNPGPGQPSSGIVDLAGPRPISARMVWTYTQDNKPAFVKQKDLEILFLDERGGGEWELATSERVNPERYLQQAIQHYIVSPRLEAVPAYTDEPSPPPAALRVTAFRDARLKEVWEQFRAGEKSSLGDVYLTWGEFVTPGGVGFVPVQLYVPARTGIEAGRQLTLFAIVSNTAGEIIEVRENIVTLAGNGADAYIDTTFRLDPGTYTATVGLAEDGRPLVLTRGELAVEGLDPEASGASPMILANNIVAGQEAYGPNEPFVFGGLKVIAKGDGVFRVGENLWYFVELRNPGLTDDGTPKVEAKIDIEGHTGERKVRMNFPRQSADITELRATENRYGVGTAIPLDTFPPGDYTIRVQLFDTVLGKTYDLSRKFQVRPS